MKQPKVLVILTVLTLFLTACPQATTPPVTPEPQPPITPDPTTFPVTAVYGTIPNWSGGEAYLTLAAGYSASSTPEGEEVTLVPPLYQAPLSATGAFTVPLEVPTAAELVTLICGADTYQVGVLGDAVASSTPEPALADEFLGFYTLGPSDSQITNAAWVYSARTQTIDASCTLLGSSPAAVKLKLVPGWNQAVLTQGEPVRLESGAIPASFVWSQF